MILSISSLVLVLAADPATELARAHAAYDDGDFAAAAELYAALADSFDDPDLHYDHGNAALRAGQLGRAIAAYHRAASARPRDPDVEANLAFARAKVQDALEPPSPSKLVSTLFFWHHSASRAELAWTAAVLSVLLWTCLGASMLWAKTRGLRLTAAALAVPLVAVLASLAVRTLAPQRVAVVTAPEAAIRSGTGADTVLRFTLRDGAEVRWSSREDEWVRVSLPDGAQGWGKTSDLALLER